MKKSFLCKLFTERKYAFFLGVFLIAFYFLPVIFIINFIFYCKVSNGLFGFETTWNAFKNAFIPIAIWTCQVGILWWLIYVDPTYTGPEYDKNEDDNEDNNEDDSEDDNEDDNDENPFYEFFHVDDID